MVPGGIKVLLLCPRLPLKSLSAKKSYLIFVVKMKCSYLDVLSSHLNWRMYPTNPFTILEPHDQEIGEFYLVRELRATDFEAPKLWKGFSGRLVTVKKNVSYLSNDTKIWAQVKVKWAPFWLFFTPKKSVEKSENSWGKKVRGGKHKRAREKVTSSSPFSFLHAVFNG